MLFDNYLSRAWVNGHIPASKHIPPTKIFIRIQVFFNPSNVRHQMRILVFHFSVPFDAKRLENNHA
jgi:hypothetical protein